MFRGLGYCIFFVGWKWNVVFFCLVLLFQIEIFGIFWEWVDNTKKRFLGKISV